MHWFNSANGLLLLRTIKNKNELEKDILVHRFDIIPKRKHKQIDKLIEKGKLDIVKTYDLTE